MALDTCGRCHPHTQGSRRCVVTVSSHGPTEWPCGHHMEAPFPHCCCGAVWVMQGLWACMVIVLQGLRVVVVLQGLGAHVVVVLWGFRAYAVIAMQGHCTHVFDITHGFCGN